MVGVRLKDELWLTVSGIISVLQHSCIFTWVKVDVPVHISFGEVSAVHPYFPSCSSHPIAIGIILI